MIEKIRLVTLIYFFRLNRLSAISAGDIYPKYPLGILFNFSYF